MPSEDLKFKDLGIGQLVKDLKEMNESTITIGFQGPSGAAVHTDAGVPMATVAQWMEFGTPGSDDRQYDRPRSLIPSRPLVRTTFELHSKQMKALIKKAFSDLIDGRASLDKAQQVAGEAASKLMRETLDRSRSWAEPLAESTASAKGHSQPLLDSGQLRDAISWAYRSPSGTIKKQGS